MSEYVIDVRVDPGASVRQANRVKDSLRGVEGQSRRTESALLKVFAAAGAGAAIAKGIGLLADYGQEMSTVRAVTRATDKQFKQLDATAQKLGRSTRFSATQAAGGMTLLARAGFNAEQVVATIEPTLQLAQAGGLGLARAADIASNALQGFQLQVGDTNRVVDVLALASNRSNTSVGQLGDALSFAAPIAAGLSVEIEETTAAIGLLSNAGIQGSRAGTGLARVMAELESPTESTRKVLKSFGIDAENVKVSSVGLEGALQMLAESGLDTGAAYEAFGQRGGPAISVLLDTIRASEDGEGALKKFADELRNSAGSAEEMADIMDDNLKGSLLAARSALEGLILSIGDAGATDVLITGMNILAMVLRFAGDNAEFITVALVAMAVQAAYTSVAQSTLIATTLASGRAFLAKTSALRLSTVAMIAARVAAIGLGQALLVFLASNPILLGITAIAAAFILLRDNSEDAEASIQRAEGALNDYRAATTKLERDHKLLNDKVVELKEGMEDLSVAAQDTARLEIDAIEKRIEANEGLRDSYVEVLEAQLEQAKLDKLSGSELAKEAGIGRFNTTETGPIIASGGGLMGSNGLNRQTITERSEEEILAIFDAELDAYRKLSEAETALTDKQRERYQELVDLNTRRLEQEQDIGELSRYLERIRSGESVDDGKKKPDNDNEFSGGGKVDVTFQDELDKLRERTELLKLDERARERRNEVLKFQDKLERKLAEGPGGEREQVEAEVSRQQDLVDIDTFNKRIAAMEAEISVMGLSNREAEHRQAQLELESDLLGEVDPKQRERVASLVNEAQAIRDGKAIDDRLTALANEARILGEIGPKRAALAEIIRLETKLEGQLSDIEKGWITNAVELNAELDRRGRILESIRNPNREAIEDHKALNDLYRDGTITLAEYNAELQKFSGANAIRSLDQELRDGGANIGPSAFEQTRYAFENAQRAGEGGGIDDGTNATLGGLSGQQLGVGGELEAIRQETQDRLNVIREAREEELLTEQEFLTRKQAILDQSIQDSQNALMAGLQVQLGAAENLFGSLTQIAANTAGEQSGIYKAMFAVQKAFAVAQATVSIAQGLARAQELGFPANIGEMARVAAAGASIISTIQGARANFRDGGLPGYADLGPGLIHGPGGPRSDSIPAMVSTNEFISNAETTSKNIGLLHALNNDPDFMKKVAPRMAFRNGGLPGSSGPSSSMRAANDHGAGMTVYTGDIIVNPPEGMTEGEGKRLGNSIMKGIMETAVKNGIKKEMAPRGILNKAYGGGR